VFNAHYIVDGAVVFQKRLRARLRRYRIEAVWLTVSVGRSKYWVKVKNPKPPGVKREAEEDWGRS